MLGAVLGLGCAATFGANAIITRRGVLRASSHYIATLSILTGPLFFLIVAGLTGDLFRLDECPWQATVFLALSGIIHFVFGRTWGFKSIQLIGSNRAYVVLGLSPVISIALAMLAVGETVKPLTALGIIFSLSGPLLTLLKEKRVDRDTTFRVNEHGKEVDRRTFFVGMLFGLGAAVFWGSSSIFIKLGLEKGGTPVGGSLIAYLAALIAISPLFLNREKRREILKPDKRSFQLALFSGLSTNVAQVLRCFALKYGSVILITFMIQTTPLWVLLLSFMFNRKVESFSRWVLLGNALLIVGTILVIIS